jgi:hypothetical protein
VIPELQTNGQNLDDLPLLKSACMKFVYFFRNQIPDAYVSTMANMMADYLKSEFVVNQSYAAACVEKMLIRKSLSDPSKTVLNENNVDLALL